jgi:hypothetical protein
MLLEREAGSNFKKAPFYLSCAHHSTRYNKDHRAVRIRFPGVMKLHQELGAS